MAGKKLGRGLRFLLSENTPPTSENELTDHKVFPETNVEPNERQIEINLDKIKSNPYQPRHNWEEAPLARLADSIKINGVLQPILVRRLGNTYQIIAGERRVRAARIAGMEKIPAIVRDATPEEMQTLALIENIQREDLNPIEKAKSFNSLKQKTGLSQEVLSKNLGIKRSTLTNYLRLLELPSSIISRIEKGNLSMGHARAILSAPPEMRKELADEVDKKRFSVRETEEKARALSQKKHKSAPPTKTKKKPAWLQD